MLSLVAKKRILIKIVKMVLKVKYLLVKFVFLIKFAVLNYDHKKHTSV